MNRRDFISKTTKTCIGCCALMSSPSLLAHAFQNNEKIDPQKLNYCSYQCPEKCPWLCGSNNNDIELKKKGYADWKIKERMGLEFNAESMYCFGCKNEDKPEGFLLKKCTVRTCAKEKGYEACIECEELSDCDKELWDRFPSFKEAVIELQKKYQEQQA